MSQYQARHKVEVLLVRERQADHLKVSIGTVMYCVATKGCNFAIASLVTPYGSFRVAVDSTPSSTITGHYQGQEAYIPLLSMDACSYASQLGQRGVC